MDGKVYADARAKCKCGANSFKLKIPMGEFNIPYCDKCHHPPDRFRLSAYYPDSSKKSGKSKTRDIRHDDRGRRITTPDVAVYMLRQIEKEIEDGIFNPDKYTSQTNREKFTIKYISQKYVEHTKERMSWKEGGVTEPTYDKVEQCSRLHIIPLFGELDVQSMDSKIIRKIYQKCETNRRRVREELKATLNFAQYELLYKFDMPEMPKAPQRVLKSETKIPDVEALYKISDFLIDPVHIAAVKVAGLYLIRPCDVVAMKMSQIKDGVIEIDSHVSKTTDIDGRKSDKLKQEVCTHTVPVTQQFLDIINEIPMHRKLLNETEYLFPNHTGKGFLPLKTLGNAWRKARKKASLELGDTKLAKAELYESIKHAGVIKLLELNYSEEKIMRITGIGREALKHYARIHAKHVTGAIIDLANFREKKEAI